MSTGDILYMLLHFRLYHWSIPCMLVMLSNWDVYWSSVPSTLCWIGKWSLKNGSHLLWDFPEKWGISGDLMIFVLGYDLGSFNGNYCIWFRWKVSSQFVMPLLLYQNQVTNPYGARPSMASIICILLGLSSLFSLVCLRFFMLIDYYAGCNCWQFSL